MEYKKWRVKMKTPTKEQIEKVMVNSSRCKDSCLGRMHCDLYYHCFEMTRDRITEWEKIRNSPK